MVLRKDVKDTGYRDFDFYVVHSIGEKVIVCAHGWNPRREKDETQCCWLDIKSGQQTPIPTSRELEPFDYYRRAPEFFAKQYPAPQQTPLHFRLDADRTFDVEIRYGRSGRQLQIVSIAIRDLE